MIREVVVHVKLGSVKRSIENFGANRYLIKTDLVNHAEVNKDVIFMLSKYMGLPENRFSLIKGEEKEDKVFSIS